MERPGIPDVLAGRVQAGKGDAAQWLRRFQDAYRRKTGIPIFPGSLNLVLDQPFDWFAESLAPRVITFAREEYGGERDILLLPCQLRLPRYEAAFLWSTTTAARWRPDPRVVEIIASVNLRGTYSLADGDRVEIEISG